MDRIKKLLLWGATGFFVLGALVYFFSFAGIFSLLAAALLAPIEKWQAFLKKFLKKPVKIIVIVVLFILMVSTAPVEKETEQPDEPKDVVGQQQNEENVTFDDLVEDDENQGTMEEPSSETLENSSETVTENAEKTEEKSEEENPVEETPKEESKPADKPEEEKQEETPKEEDKTPIHVHSFAVATCVLPKTCSCGVTEGAANGHNWTDATCTAAKKCTTCGVIEGSAKGHNWKVATCATPKTCTVCGITEGAKADHNWKDATYDSPKKCSNCGTTQGSALEVPYKENYHGHVYTGGSSSKKYHYEADCSGKNSHEITWEEVSQRNLGPCGTCVLK